MTSVRALPLLLFATVCGVSGPSAADSPEAEMSVMYLKTEIAGQVVAESRKLAGDDATIRQEVESAANAYRMRVIAEVRCELTALFPDEDTARREYGDFVNRFVRTSTAETRSEIVRTRLAAEVESAGVFLGDVQSWIRLKATSDMPPLEAWIGRDRKASIPEKPKRRRRTNSLRDAEAGAGRFVEAADDAHGSLRSFSARRKSVRERKLAEAQQGMEQVAAERKVADDEANAKRQAAAQAEAAAQAAQAQRIAAAEQEAVVQDQNSWKTRIKGVISTAIGATAGAFAGNIGSRVGEAAANAVLGVR